MRLVFAGTPVFAATALQALLDAGHEVLGVLTQPDRPAGRGQKLQASPVKQCALAAGLPVLQPISLRLDGKYPQDAAAAQAQLTAWAPELMVVAAYGLILPRWTLDLPARGCLNIHASLLPRWRGAAPIHRAIEAGDLETGITLMQMDEGLDTGAMLALERLAIDPQDTTASLHDRLAGLGARLTVQALQQPNAWRSQPQPHEGVCYAHKIEKAEARIDWQRPAVQIERRLRAFDPFPGAHTVCEGKLLKVWGGRLADAGRAPATPGTVLANPPEGPLVACGEGVLQLTALQRPGGRRGPLGLPVGTRLGD